jgi:hypothetical protein
LLGIGDDDMDFIVKPRCQETVQRGRSSFYEERPDAVGVV